MHTFTNPQYYGGIPLPFELDAERDADVVQID
jgi:hypothetical protein